MWTQCTWQSIRFGYKNYYIIRYNMRAAGRHIDFRQMSISGQTTANNYKTAFILHVVESASDDYKF